MTSEATSSLSELDRIPNAFATLAEGMLLVNADAEVLYGNPVACRVLGYPLEELTRFVLFEINPVLNLLEWKKRWEELGTVGVLTGQWQYINRQGELFPVSETQLRLQLSTGPAALILFSGDFAADGEGPTGGSGTVDNEFTALIEFSIEHANEMVLWVEANGSIHYANPAFFKKTGHSPDQLPGLSIYELYTQPNPKADRKSLWEKLRKEHHMELEANMRLKSGKVIPVHSSLNYVKFGDREFDCLFIRDISRQRAREEQLEKARKKVDELSAKLKAENLLLRKELSEKVYVDLENIITVSEPYQRVLEQVIQVASTEATVLITGETGTGKELLAHAVHGRSHRAESPLVKVNCAALPKDLIESELFGHEKGAFTGAIGQKPGRFERAHGGTIFLDEVGELPLALQPKLLRILQDGELERVGGTKSLTVDVRVIAATNRDLAAMVEAGEFREDLYYRLNVFPILNMPLRERREDIPVLVEHFVREFAAQQGRPVPKVRQQDLRLLLRYDFPGNIRELENIVERAVILTKGEVLNLADSLNREQLVGNNKKASRGEFPTFEEMQRQHILEALRRTRGRVSGEKGAGLLLGLNDRTLASKMRKLGIDRNDFLSPA